MMVKKDNPLFEMIPPDVLRKVKILSDECLIEAEVKDLNGRVMFTLACVSASMLVLNTVITMQFLKNISEALHHTERRLVSILLLFSAIGGGVAIILAMLAWLELRVRCRLNPLTNPRDITGSLYQRKTWVFLITFVALPAMGCAFFEPFFFAKWLIAFGVILTLFVWRCAAAYPLTISTKA
jgi:hypothetical protein